MIIPIKSKGKIYELIIDDEDYEKVSKHIWHINHNPWSNNKYCETNIHYIDGKKTGLQLHRFLMGLEKGDKRVINHIDGNGLNNKRTNLEICNQLYNCQSINRKTRFGCICIVNRPKKYQACVRINKKRYQKRFYTWVEAQSYLDALKEMAIAETIPF